MSGPIIRTGATPEFWKNWDQVFGKKSKGSAKQTEKETAAKPAVTATKKKTAKPAAVKVAAKKTAPKKAAAKKSAAKPAKKK